MEGNGFFNKLEHIENIPTLPVVAIKVNKMLEDYRTSIHKLSATIEKDQAIVSKILKLVNSPFYGFRSQIDSIPRAVVVLGFDTIRNAVVTVSVIDTFMNLEATEGFSMTDYWKHSITTAVICKYLAMLTKLESPDRCFVGGLLHDIGKVILSQYFPGMFMDIIMEKQSRNISFNEAEKAILPVDHAQIGGYMAAKWHLPENLRQAIENHHIPTRSSEGRNLGMIINVGNAIANAVAEPKGRILPIKEVHPEANRLMNLQIKTASEWYAELSEEVETACRFFIEEN